MHGRVLSAGLFCPLVGLVDFVSGLFCATPARKFDHFSEVRPPNEPSKANPTAACFVDMRSTCFYVHHMTAMIQIRNVPDALHRRLKSRAALAGMSLSDYLLGEIREVAERPTVEELRNRLERRSAVMPSIAPADAARAERERQ